MEESVRHYKSKTTDCERDRYSYNQTRIGAKDRSRFAELAIQEEVALRFITFSKNSASPAQEALSELSGILGSGEDVFSPDPICMETIFRLSLRHGTEKGL